MLYALKGVDGSEIGSYDPTTIVNNSYNSSLVLIGDAYNYDNIDEITV